MRTTPAAATAEVSRTVVTVVADMPRSGEGMVGGVGTVVGVDEAVGWGVIRGDLPGREEDRAERDTFLAVQMGLDGRSRLYGELSVADTAAVVGGLDRTADRLDRDGEAAGANVTTRPTESKGACRRGRAKRRGRALVELCARALDGRTASGGRVEAKPLIVVHVPLDRLEHSSAGLVDVAVPGLLPTLSARTVEVLAGDADVQAVLVDGA